MTGSMTDVRHAIDTICDRMLDEYDSAHAVLGQELFEKSYPELLDELGGKLAADHIRRMFGDRLRSNAGTSSAQLSLPGVGDIDPIITVSDGEGGCRYKRVQKATPPELAEDEQILAAQKRAVTASHERAQLRNRTLLPLMERHGFATAGEAIAWLLANGDVA